MLEVITDAQEIEECQSAMESALRRQLTQSGTYRVGHLGENYDLELIHNDRLWFGTSKLTDAPSKRYWNAFGTKLVPKASVVLHKVVPPAVIA